MWKFSPISQSALIGKIIARIFCVNVNGYIEDMVTFLQWQKFIPPNIFAKFLSRENFVVYGTLKGAHQLVQIIVASFAVFVHFFCSQAYSISKVFLLQ